MRPTIVCGLGLLLMTGCGTGVRTFPVQGTVVFEDGTPAKELAGGRVSFESVVNESNASGEIGPDGTYRLKTPLGGDGAISGSHRVLVLPPEAKDPDNPQPPIIAVKYHRYDTSGIVVSVVEKSNDIPIKLPRLSRTK